MCTAGTPDEIIAPGLDIPWAPHSFCVTFSVIQGMNLRSGGSIASVTLEPRTADTRNVTNRVAWESSLGAGPRRPAIHGLAPRGADSIRSAIYALVLTASVVSLYAAEGLRIVPLVRDDSVLVSFELTDGYTEEVRDAVKSGLKTIFTYTVELRQDVPAWVDRTIATSVVTNSVQYDNLTRRATLVRTMDGHVELTESTEDEAVIRLWMTTFQKMPLFRTAELEQNREYYVRVRATARPTNGSMLWPWGSGISGITKFTFLR